jgi:hypothetical protein
MITVDPPVVQPSLGLIVFMHGVASGIGGYRPRIDYINDFIVGFLAEKDSIKNLFVFVSRNYLFAIFSIPKRIVGQVVLYTFMQ